MRTLLMSLLIIAGCVGLDAGECKKKHKTEQQKENYRQSRRQEKDILHNMKKQDEYWKKKKKHCAAGAQQTRPVDKLIASNHRVKRDSNGDRV